MRRSIGSNTPRQVRQVSGWRATLSASCASLVGIGLARFAYTPLLPAVIGAHWFAPSTAAYLGVANLAGYLAGALLARPLAARLPAAELLRGLMLLVVAAFLGCAMPVSFAWFFAWRLLSGIAGGALMVLAATAVLPHVPHRRRGVASGVIFAGVGLGIAASGTLVPLLLREGLPEAWYGLAALSLFLTVIAWGGWPADPAAPSEAVKHRPHVVRRRPSSSHRPTWRLRSLYAEYALNAAGLVPHMLFLVDFVARGLGQGVDSGSHYWVLFGLGAIVGPVLSGHLADRTGFGPALRLAFLLQAVAVVLPALEPGTVSLVVSSLIVGAFTPGIVPLVLGRIHELLPHDTSGQRTAWSSATTGFALLQAAGGYGLAFMLAQAGNNYPLLFFVGGAAILAALSIDLVMGIAAPAFAVGGLRRQRS